MSFFFPLWLPLIIGEKPKAQSEFTELWLAAVYASLVPFGSFFKSMAHRSVGSVVDITGIRQE